MPEYIVSFCIGYLIGSIPTAYLVVKRTSNVDIRTVGSGNVGGRNALDVTGKKSIGVLVVLIDVLKGIASVALANYFFEENSLSIAAAMIGSVTGHCYPVWLKFKGGRGLATAAGVFLITSWLWVVLWLGLYFVSSKVLKNIHISSVVALAVTPIFAWFISGLWKSYPLIINISQDVSLIAGVLVISVCITKHIQPIKEIYEQKNS